MDLEREIELIFHKVGLDDRKQTKNDVIALFYKYTESLQLLQTDVSSSVCKNCNKPFVMHSRASGLCPDKFKHFE